MNSWQRWLKAPQTLWFRKVLFQIHLWMGVGFGIYIFLISVSGSAVVLRPEFNRWFVGSRVIPQEAEPMSGQALEMAVALTYSDYEIIRVAEPPFRSRAVYVLLSKEGEEISHYFNQYTGEDQGETYPWQVSTIEKLVQFHDELWLGRLGRTINGIGGAVLILMVLSGLVIWWQGRRRWYEGIMIRRKSLHSFNWQLHSFLGFWSLLLLFSWGLTAIYFAFPAPFDWVIDSFDNDPEDFERPDGWLLFLLKIHFGRFGGLTGRIIWIVLGLLPCVMFVTGFILWWKRVVKKA